MFKCQNCKKEFSTWQELRQHLSDNHLCRLLALQLIAPIDHEIWLEIFSAGLQPGRTV